MLPVVKFFLASGREKEIANFPKSLDITRKICYTVCSYSLCERYPKLWQTQKPS